MHKAGRVAKSETTLTRCGAETGGLAGFHMGEEEHEVIEPRPWREDPSAELADLSSTRETVKLQTTIRAFPVTARALICVHGEVTHSVTLVHANLSLSLSLDPTLKQAKGLNDVCQAAM